MGPINLALWAVGAVLVVLGYLRARGPWARYQALKAQEQNIARYESWRGGARDHSTTGASVMLEMVRREARLWGGVAVAGIILIIAGFAVR
jgi:hypothetical protein